MSISEKLMKQGSKPSGRFLVVNSYPDLQGNDAGWA